MAETLTVDTSPQTETLGESLTPDEQESLAIGEEMSAQQDQLLAGKYKDAAELEKAYMELEGKLGKKEEEPEAVEESEESESEEEPSDVSFLDKLWDEANSEFTDETMKELNSMNPKDLARMHLEYRNQNQRPQVTEKQVTQLKEVAGGEKEYESMINWAQGAMTKQEIEMYDAVMETGDPLGCFFAVQALKYRYDDASGVDGKMITGKAPSNQGDQYKSQAEVVRAMSDPKYENDPAYRDEVKQKLDRSNIDF